MSRQLQVWGLSSVCLLAAAAAGMWYWQCSQPEYRLRRAQAAMRAGDYAAAEASAAALEADGCRDESLLLRAESLLLRAEAQNHSEELAVALTLLNRVPAESDRAIEAATLSGRCLLRVGNLVDAERTFAYVLSLDAECVAAHRGLMAVYYDLGALSAARHHAKEWAKRAPRDGRPHRFIALMHKDLGHYQEAIAPYRAALERELTDQARAEASLELAQCLIRGGQFAEAEEVLDATRPPAALLSRVLTAQAECERALDRSEAARELIARALEAEPQYTEALRISAHLSLDAEDPAGAARLLERAAALAPNEFDTYHLLGRAYSTLGESKKAEAAQRRVKEIQGQLEELTKLTQELMSRPKDATLHRKLADVFARLNMREMAAARRRVAATLDRASPSTAPALAMP
jgi:tetratricopeptide (TPR) repeat protein